MEAVGWEIESAEAISFTFLGPRVSRLRISNALLGGECLADRSRFPRVQLQTEDLVAVLHSRSAPIAPHWAYLL